MAARGRLPKDPRTEEYLLRIASGAFDDKERAAASVPDAPGEYNPSILAAYRRLAIEALGHARNLRAVNPLIDILRDREATMLHASVAAALAEISDEKAVPALEEALTRAWFESTPEALRALVALNDRNAPGLAVARLSDDRYGLLAKELRRLTGASPGETPEAWREWWDRNRDTWRPSPREPSRTPCGEAL